MRRVSKAALLFLAMIVCMGAVNAQQTDPSGNVEGPIQPREKKKTEKPPAATATAPQNEEASPYESSSNQTKIDLRPPMGDLTAHPQGGHEAERALNQKPYNPLRAIKDVEVGDFYYKAGNYHAALSRYRDALEYKPRDADATLKVARTLERTKFFREARECYQLYLEILKDGPGAGEARQALERLKTHAELRPTQ